MLWRKLGPLRDPASLLISAGAVAGALACGGPDPTAPLPVYNVSALTPEPLSAPAGSELVPALEIVVRDPDGVVAKGVAVRFRVVAGAGASLTDTLVATNADGIGASRLRLGVTRDSVVVAASVRGQEDRGVTFKVVATAPPELLSLQPASFSTGDTIVLRGVRLNEPGGTDVFFGSSAGRVVGPVSDSLVRAVVPPCIAGGRVAVAVRSGTSTTNAISVSVENAATPLQLGVGEGITVRGSEAGCLHLGTGGERYIIVPQLATWTDSIPVARSFSLAVDASSTVLAAPEPAVPNYSRQASASVPNPSSVPMAFEAMLRAAEQETARSLAPGDGPRPPSAGPPAFSRSVTPINPPPAFGSVRTFHVLSRLDGTQFGSSSARLRFVGSNILLYEDIGSPEPLSDSAATSLGDLFDRTLYPIDTKTFGSESDIDENGRVIVLMTPLVNGLAASAACATSGYVRGFFYGADLDTRNRNSNRGEIFYAMVPDSKGERSCPHTLDDVAQLLPPTFLHEFQHMISFNQHVLVRRGSPEAVWLNEGLSHVAEELGARYYDDAYPAPSGRTMPSALLPDSAVPFIRGDLENAALYVAATQDHSVTAFQGFGTLEDRGASWLFLRWLGAQKGTGVYARLVQSGLRSGENVESAAGEDFASLFGDFALALYADSIPGVSRTSLAPRYRMGARSLRELEASALGHWTLPLQPRPAPAAGVPTIGAMVQGTVAYYALTVPAGGAVVRFAGPNGSPLPAGLVPRVGVLRITP
jgi:hypothetical protein